MANVKLEKSTAIKLYPEAPNWFKTVLEESFGKDAFTKKDWNNFETFEDLCQAIGTTEEDFNEKWDPSDFDPGTIAFERIKVCTRAYNQAWQHDTYNTNQKKWYPYFTVSSSGLGFSYSYYDYGNAHASVGSRLCFLDEARSTHAGKTFIKLFEDFITAKY
jgi:hypothetical protein